MRTCEIDGCDRRHYARGLCNMHYLRQYRHGTTGPAASTVVADPLERLLSLRAIDPDTGCWLVPPKANGYAYLSVDNRQVSAHRFVYERLVGPIPDGMQIDHVHARGCRHRNCVNPEHLEPVTQAENLRRWAESVTECPQGHPYDETNTYWRKDRPGHRQCRACASSKNRSTAA
jgi:hypothetical protein